MRSNTEVSMSTATGTVHTGTCSKFKGTRREHHLLDINLKQVKLDREEIHFLSSREPDKI